MTGSSARAKERGGREGERTEEPAVLVAHASLHLGDTQVDIKQSLGTEQCEYGWFKPVGGKSASREYARGVVTARLQRLDEIRPKSGLDRDLEASDDSKDQNFDSYAGQIVE